MLIDLFVVCVNCVICVNCCRQLQMLKNRWSSIASAAASRETILPAPPVQDGDEPTTVRGGDEHTMFQGGDEENGPDQQAPDEHPPGGGSDDDESGIDFSFNPWLRLPLPPLPDTRPSGSPVGPALHCLECLDRQLTEKIAELEPLIRDNYLANDMQMELRNYRWIVQETQKWVRVIPQTVIRFCDCPSQG